MLDTIDTVPNPKGLSAFSPSLEGCYLAVRASATKGSVLVYNVMDLQSHTSEQGTLIRVHLVSEATKSYSFRRGTYPSTIYSLSFWTINNIFSLLDHQQYIHCLLDHQQYIHCLFGPSTIYSLSFGPSTQLPDILIATTSSGSIHAFSLMLAINQRSKRSTSFLGSVLPDSVSDAVHHHVLQNAFSSGIRRFSVSSRALPSSGSSQRFEII